MEEKKNFEQSILELEGIVKSLEGDLPLDEAIDAFNKGIKLSKVCLDELNEKKGTLKILTDELENITKEFSLD